MLNLDTHVLIFALSGDLKPAEDTSLRASRWGISAIVLWEVAKLAQLGRIGVDLADASIKRAIGRLHVWPVTLEVAVTSTRLDVRGIPRTN